MRRVFTTLVLLVLAAGAVVGGYRLERSGLADQAVDALTPSGVVPTTEVPDVPPARPDGDEPPALADPVSAPLPGLTYWGVHHPGAPYDQEVLADLGDRADLDPAIVMWFQEWEGQPAFPADDAAAVVDRGAVPMITWEAWDPPAVDPGLQPDGVQDVADQPTYRLARIADGAFDDYLESYARQVRAYAGPVMLRPFHEMNGFWYPWGGTVNGNRPQDLVDAWRHVHRVFERVGADNVTWVWSVNHRSVPDEPGNTVHRYWPGAQYVDWVGVSGFNFGTTSEVSDWETFDEVYGPVLDELERYDLPLALTEFGSVEAGGDKAAWIDDAVEAIAGPRDVEAVVWFDRQVRDVRDFRIDSSPAALAAVRDAVDRPDVVGAPEALRTTR